MVEETLGWITGRAVSGRDLLGGGGGKKTISINGRAEGGRVMQDRRGREVTRKDCR